MSTVPFVRDALLAAIFNSSRPTSFQTAVPNPPLRRRPSYRSTQGQRRELLGASPYQKALRRLPVVPSAFPFTTYSPMQLYASAAFPDLIRGLTRRAIFLCEKAPGRSRTPVLAVCVQAAAFLRAASSCSSSSSATVLTSLSLNCPKTALGRSYSKATTPAGLSRKSTRTGA
jgi:hypothetical protein